MLILIWLDDDFNITKVSEWYEHLTFRYISMEDDIKANHLDNRACDRAVSGQAADTCGHTTP